MPLVAVAPSRYDFGVEGPEDDWRFKPGHEKNRRRCCRPPGVYRRTGIVSAHQVIDLDNALHTHWNSDAHLVSYVLRDCRGQREGDAGAPAIMQPRFKKASLPFLRELGYQLTVEVFFADVDNPGHVPWVPELRAEAERVDRMVPAGVYYTAHGRRIVQPLSRPIVIEDDGSEMEARLSAWLEHLASVGIMADWSCTDWTRHYRLPHVRREDAIGFKSELDLSRMRPIDPPDRGVIVRRGSPRKKDHSLRKSEKVEGSVLEHAFRMAGWLGRALTPSMITIQCPYQSLHTMGHPYDTSTVLFGPTQKSPLGHVYCKHNSCSSRTQDDFVAALPNAARDMVMSHKPVTPTKEKPDEELTDRSMAGPILEDAIRKAPDGLSVIIAGCGTGKTEAAIVVATERAEKEGRRFVKTAISVPTSKLALEVAARLERQGNRVKRVFGPLSKKREDGTNECRYHETGAALSKGFLSVPWELCEGRGRMPCEYADTCTARGGVEGEKDARILVGPHALMGRLSKEAGKTGLLVIDEPPPMLKHETFTPEELLQASSYLDRYFEDKYAAALNVSISALASWILIAPLDRAYPLTAATLKVDTAKAERAFMATGTFTVIDAAKNCLDDPEDPTPPVQRQWIMMARKTLHVAQEIGIAARVAYIVWLGLTNEREAVCRVEERRGRRVLVVTIADAQLRETLKRDGSVVVADAGGEQHLPIYKRIVGYEAPVTTVRVGDGAPVERVHLERTASRSRWMTHGKIQIGPSVVRCVELFVRWANERTFKRAAIVTFKPLSIILRAALGENVEGEWAAEDSRKEVLREGALRLRPILRQLRGSLDVGHYGGVRGLDHWREHDALATLGDPWGQLSDARWESEFLRLTEGWEERLEAAARSDLEQAHGRLRTVHRTEPARALHIGQLLPGGWGSTVVKTRTDTGGRPGLVLTAEGARKAVAEAGSVAAAAKSIGTSVRTLYRLLQN